MPQEDSSELARERNEGITATNMGVLGNGPAFFTNLGFSAANDSAAGYRTINQTVIGKVAESIIETSPSEGAAGLLSTAILTKTMQTIPPVSSGQSVANQV